MPERALTRRHFMLLVGASTVVSSTVLPGCLPPPPVEAPVTIFRRSARGLKASNAAKKHNANRLYTTAAAADRDKPHPGDRSKVVSLKMSSKEFNRLFPGGRIMVDLRNV